MLVLGGLTLDKTSQNWTMDSILSQAHQEELLVSDAALPNFMSTYFRDYLVFV